MEEKKSDSSKQMMAPETYNDLCKDISEIIAMISPNSKKITNKKALDMLLDLERQIDKFTTMYKIIRGVEMAEKGITSVDDPATKTITCKIVLK